MVGRPGNGYEPCSSEGLVRLVKEYEASDGYEHEPCSDKVLTQLVKDHEAKYG
jgi:hypothetical protein